MKASEAAARHIGALLDMEPEFGGDKYVFSRTRTIEIGEGDLIRRCLFDWVISFENHQHNGLAGNKAELYLRVEEREAFLPALIQNEHPLPADYRQWQEEKAGIVCIHLEATEPPEVFAGRLAAALHEIEQ